MYRSWVGAADPGPGFARHERFDGVVAEGAAIPEQDARRAALRALESSGKLAAVQQAAILDRQQKSVQIACRSNPAAVGIQVADVEAAVGQHNPVGNIRSCTPGLWSTAVPSFLSRARLLRGV